MTPSETQPTVENDLDGWIDARAEAIATYLLDLVEIETPTEEPACFDRFFERIGADFTALDMQVERTEGDETGGWLEAWTAGTSPDDEIQLILGHADTVWPRGTVEERPPGIDGDRLQGPGTLDMKGGLTQLVFALRALDVHALEPPLPIYVLVSSDEEIGSPESKSRIVELAKRANRVFVLEPADGPTGKIKIARKAAGTFTIAIEGEAAHAGLDPEAGASAIEELGQIIPQLHDLTDIDAGVTVNVGEIDAGLRSNVIAPEAYAEVDVRAPTDDDAASIEDEIRSLAPATPGTTITVEGGFARPPMERTPGNRLLWQRVQEIAHRMDLELEGTRSGGASDGNDASQHAPTIDGFGAVGDGAHQTYEYVELPALRERVSLLARCLLDAPLPASPEEELDE